MTGGSRPTLKTTAHLSAEQARCPAVAGQPPGPGGPSTSGRPRRQRRTGAGQLKLSRGVRGCAPVGRLYNLNWCHHSGSSKLPGRGTARPRSSRHSTDTAAKCRPVRAVVWPIAPQGLIFRPPLYLMLLCDEDGKLSGRASTMVQCHSTPTKFHHRNHQRPRRLTAVDAAGGSLLRCVLLARVLGHKIRRLRQSAFQKRRNESPRSILTCTKQRRRRRRRTWLPRVFGAFLVVMTRFTYWELVIMSALSIGSSSSRDSGDGGSLQ